MNEPRAASGTAGQRVGSGTQAALGFADEPA